MRFIYYLFLISILSSQNLYWGLDIGAHVYSVSDAINSDLKYNGRPALEYSLFIQGDLTYESKWSLKVGVGEKVAREDASKKGDYFDWRFYYYNITPEVLYYFSDQWYGILGYSISILDQATYLINSESSDARIPVQINTKNVGFEATDMISRIEIGVGYNFHFKSLIFSPQLVYFHGINDAVEKNDEYAFIFSSISTSLSISF